MKDRSFESVLEFWFGTLKNGFADDVHRKLWFKGGTEADETIRRRFEPLIIDAGARLLLPWLEGAQSCLAFVLVCDQFPRQTFRGTSAAFACDSLSLEAATAAIDSGIDRRLGFDERAFLYMPFQHSEIVADQQRSIELYTQLRDETPDELRHITSGFLTSAQQHRDIIARFGRFPHRNVVLERESSSKELDFIAGSGGFGQ